MVRVALLASCLLLSACESTALLEEILASSSGGDASLSSETVADGLREALTVGAGRAVSTLGQDGGFLESAFRIPLPEQLKTVQEVAGRVGLSGPLDELELRMNRAAEQAAPKAQALFVGAIKQMSFSDVMDVYRGGDDAATRYLERSTGDALQSQMRPVVDNALAQVGAARTLDDLLGRYNALPFVKPVELDLTQHVLGYASGAVFEQLAEEEAAIRKDPLKRSTELLRTVFGGG